MLESLSLRSFQVHRRYVIEFDPHVTTIIGDSDAGKSSILRALRWVTLNQFDGPSDSFISWGKSFAKVILVADGKTIERAKGKENLYKFGDKEFKAFGFEKVPEQIQNLLKLSEVNFQAQLDLHFWFSESPGKVSKYLNQIVNLDSIDHALEDVAQQQRKAKANRDLCQSRYKESKRQREALTWTVQADRDLRAMEKLESRIHDKASKIDSLRSSLSDVKRVNQTLANAGDELLLITETVKLAESTLIRSSKLESLKSAISRLADANKAAAITIPTLPSMAKLVKLTKRTNKLKDLLKTLNQTNLLLRTHELEIEQVTKQVQTLTKGKCPICKSPLSSAPTSTCATRHP